MDVVYHLAAAQHEAGKPDEHFRSVNVDGTRNMLEACRDAGVVQVVTAEGAHQLRRGSLLE